MEGRALFALQMVTAGKGMFQIEEAELSKEIIAGIFQNIYVNM